MTIEKSRRKPETRSGPLPSTSSLLNGDVPAWRTPRRGYAALIERGRGGQQDLCVPKATRSSLAMDEAKRRCLANDIEAVGAELQRQTVMLVSAIKDVLDVVSKNKGRRCLVRRKADLETALESYERASVSLQQIADSDTCAAATKARRTLVDSSDEALDQLEAFMEVKAEENVGAEQEEEEFSADEDDVEDRAIRSHDVDQAAEVEVGCAKTDEAFQSGERDPGEGGQSDANDELKSCAARRQG